jgi:hypothetical protein
MTDIFEEFKKRLSKEDIDTTDPNSEEKKISMGELSSLVEVKLAKEAEEARLLEELNNLQKDIKYLNQVIIPKAMIELGFNKVTTTSGAEVTITKNYRGNISEAHAEDAFEWFIATNQADSIKNKYEVTLGVGKSDEALKVEKALESAGVFYKNKQDIAWNTLAGILKDLDSNDSLSDNAEWKKLQEEGKVNKEKTLREVLGAYDYFETKIKFKK